jgi:hypothetical protein
MIITTNAADRRRITPIREHVYTLPVVRELPAHPPDPVGAHGLW